MYLHQASADYFFLKMQLRQEVSVKHQLGGVT